MLRNEDPQLSKAIGVLDRALVLVFHSSAGRTNFLGRTSSMRTYCSIVHV
jgi:hypothetical protein